MADVPDWLDTLVATVANAMMAHGLPGRMGFRYAEEDGTWEVLVYTLPVELVGGPHDGEVVAPGFSLDVEQLRSAFTRVDAISWQAQSFGEHDNGPLVSI